MARSRGVIFCLSFLLLVLPISVPHPVGAIVNSSLESQCTFDMYVSGLAASVAGSVGARVACQPIRLRPGPDHVAIDGAAAHVIISCGDMMVMLHI